MQENQGDMHCLPSAPSNHNPRDEEPHDIGAAQFPVALGACNEDVA